MLLMGITQSLFAEGRATYTFSGWIEETELQTIIKLDTSLVTKTNWEAASSSEVKTTGYFYTNKSGEPVFKITKIDIPKKALYQTQEEDIYEVDEIDTNDQYNKDQEHDHGGE